ncbi:serine carboxypeptidase-like 18 isoform X2 [Dioscorea cayenensis subsp. rotundata]|uniref:Serine carboxypeptidase-like 18 isoform X2 n=1 Tax=Dioscorea cayennensis subsp. rotundata TaxID=55577 RepID=A0AB40CM48_DIOCR|nr:serine carboxypeptidase-like 18 isoform X2 [Dioscorea cayenensis subsp. rotundata]
MASCLHLQLLCQLLLLLSPLFISASVVTHLPGFDGPLPFHMETGYVGVDEVQFFYHFIESEGNPAENPLILWLTGGPGCSSFSGLVFEVGPLRFRRVKYDGSLPTLVYHPFAWTKVSNMIFLDSPFGYGFSFSNNPETYVDGDVTSSLRVYKFLRKWLIDHPQFLSNPLYIAGDSYGGKVTPVITELISQGIESGAQPILNLKGYLIGNPVTGEAIDKNAQVPYAHNMGIISDEIYKSTTISCEGEDYENPTNALCAKKLQVVKKYFDEISNPHILEPKCPQALPKPQNLSEKSRFLMDDHREFIMPPMPPFKCRSYTGYLSYIWANNDGVRDALHIQKYVKDIPSSVKYQHKLTSQGYRALVYSGDHDLVIPHIGTQTWVRSLNYSIVDDWRSWFSSGQVAGYTRTYTHNLTFATIKGAGHTAPEYKPRETLDMIKRWLSYQPL